MSKLGLSTRKKEMNTGNRLSEALDSAQSVAAELRQANDTATALESMILFPLIADARALVYNINDFITARDQS